MTARAPALALRLAIALALALSSLAHRPAGARAPTSSDYRLPDGTVAVLCLSGSGENEAPVADGPCEFCRLANALALPDPVAGWLPLQPVAGSCLVPPRHAGPPPRRARSLGPPCRAPPERA